MYNFYVPNDDVPSGINSSIKFIFLLVVFTHLPACTEDSARHSIVRGAAGVSAETDPGETAGIGSTVIHQAAMATAAVLVLETCARRREHKVQHDT